MLDFVHVGDYKTGTTWLQKYGFRNHPEIHYLGDYFENRKYHSLFHELVDARDLDFDAPSLRRRFLEQIAKENSGSKKVGVSREVLSQTNFITGEHARRNADRIKAVFGPTKIIYIIREQISMLCSMYSQYIKIGGTLNLKDFIFDSIQSKGLINRLKYHKNIAMYKEIFGRENVHVSLFEEFCENRGGFLSRIYGFIGCRDIFYFPEGNSEKLNTSLTRAGCLIQRFFNRFVRTPYNPSANLIPVDKLIGSFVSSSYKEKAERNTILSIIPNYGNLDRDARLSYYINISLINKISKFASSVRVGSRLRVRERTKNLLINEFKDSNKILSEVYGINVKKYNWFC